MKKETFFLKMSAVTLMLLMTFCVIFSACSMDDDLYIKPKTLATRSTHDGGETPSKKWWTDEGEYAMTEFEVFNNDFSYAVTFEWTAGTMYPTCNSEVNLRNLTVSHNGNSTHDVILEDGETLRCIRLTKIYKSDDGTDAASWTSISNDAGSAKIKIKFKYYFEYEYVNDSSYIYYCRRNNIDINFNERPSGIQKSPEQKYEGIYEPFSQSLIYK